MSTDGAKVWIPDAQELWVRADILEKKGAEVKLRVEGGAEKSINVEAELKACGVTYDANKPALPLQNPPTSETGLQDMANFDYLHEPAVLDNLAKRHKSGNPYTYTGGTIVSVNPYKWDKELYTDKLRRSFLVKSRAELIPHTYSASARAYMDMHMLHQNQSILVSGESGAGKTETVKVLMSHLAAVSNDRALTEAAQNMAGEDGEEDLVAKTGEEQNITIQKILQSNPLLEAFGNAKTSRNDNSSRFGKFVQLQFNMLKGSVLVGAHTNTYLLEKSRVVWQADGERNYHIFHQMLAADTKEKTSLKLNSTSFKYVRDGKGMIEGQSDAEHFKTTKDALNLLGVPLAQQAWLFRMLSGVINLGNVQFSGDEQRSDVNSGSEKALGLASELIGVEQKTMALALTTREMVTRGGASVTRVPLSVEGAGGALEATAKGIYTRLFDWLVERINKSTGIGANGGSDGGTKRASALGLNMIQHIDLLDIFGFESFEHNSFEQLCINYANETLQQQFCRDVFKSVQDEYKAEGIPLGSIAFSDNKDVLDLIESRTGLLSLLNEECLRPGGNSPSFASKAVQQWAKEAGPKKGNDSGVKPPLERVRKNDMHFTIHHYADSVTYDATGWCEKNKDSLHADMSKLLTKSNNAFVRELFGMQAGGSSCQESKSPKGRAGGPRKGSTLAVNTVAMQFREQVVGVNKLKSLMKSITQTSVQYVRCVKPNKTKSSMDFDKRMVVEQLRSAGVVEAIRMSRAAFPNRMLLDDFGIRFMVLEKGKGKKKGKKSAKEVKAMVPSLVEQYSKTSGKVDLKKGGDLYVFGKTKVFFAKGVLEALEDARLDNLSDSVVLIQKIMRGCKARRDYRFYMNSANAVVRIQAWERMVVGRWKLKVKRRVTINLQAKHRGKTARRRVIELRQKKLEEAKSREKQLAQVKEMKKAAAEAAAKKAAKKAKDKKAAAEAEKAAAEAKAAADEEERNKQMQIASSKADAEAKKKEENDKKEALRLSEQTMKDSEVKKKKQEEEATRLRSMPAMSDGLEYELKFEKGPLGICFTGDTVVELQTDGQAHKLGVIVGSSIVAIGGKPLKSVWEVQKRLSTGPRPLKVKFKKPGLRRVVQRRQSVDFRELEYDVEFQDGPLGIELDIKLSVKSLSPDGQAQRGNVRVGSSMVAVGGVPVANIRELAIAMKEATKPVTLRFRRKRRKKRTAPQTDQQKVDEEKKEKEYLEWLYGRAGSTDTSTVFRMKNAEASVEGF